MQGAYIAFVLPDPDPVPTVGLRGGTPRLPPRNMSSRAKPRDLNRPSTIHLRYPRPRSGTPMRGRYPLPSLVLPGTPGTHPNYAKPTRPSTHTRYPVPTPTKRNTPPTTMPRQTEPNANNALGSLLQDMMPRGLVRSENTQAISGQPSLRPDIIPRPRPRRHRGRVPARA